MSAHTQASVSLTHTLAAQISYMVKIFQIFSKSKNEWKIIHKIRGSHELPLSRMSRRLKSVFHKPKGGSACIAHHLVSLKAKIRRTRAKSVFHKPKGGSACIAHHLVSLKAKIRRTRTHIPRGSKEIQRALLFLPKSWNLQPKLVTALKN